MNTIFLQIDVNEQIDNVLQVTPATMGGYGLALLILIVFCIIFYRRSEKIEKLKNDHVERMLAFATEQTELLVKLTIAMESNKDMPQLIRDCKRMIGEIYDLQKELNKK